MRDLLKALKVECAFAISEMKAGYIRLWQLVWATLVAPFKVFVEFANGKGRWAVHYPADPDAQLSALGIECVPIIKWCRAHGFGGSIYYRSLGMLCFINCALLAFYLFLRVMDYFNAAR